MTDNSILQEVLDLLAWSGPADMDISLVTAVLDKKEEELIPALQEGVKLELLKKNKKEEQYRLDDNKRAELREKAPLPERTDWINTVGQRMGEWFEERRRVTEAQTLLGTQEPHFREWLEHVKPHSPIHASRINWLLAYPPFHQGKLEEAEKLVGDSIKMLEQSPDEKLKADLLDDLGAISLAWEKPEAALKHYEETLEIRQKLFGEKHAETAISMDNIADALGKMGELEKSLEYQEKVLNIRRDLFGEEHEDTALSYNNVGTSYYDAGRYGDALAYLEKAFQLRRGVLGDQEIDTIESLHNLAICLINLKKLKDAYELVNKFLKILPQDHPKYMEIASLIMVIDRDAVKSGFRPLSTQKTKPGGGKKKKKKKKKK